MLENTNIAGVIMTFDRPQYTYKFIKSLERCIDIDDIDWIFLQDGAVNKFSNNRVANDKDIQKNINIIETANIPNKEIRKNEYNLSIALQRDKMFDLFNEKYDLILQFENDIILGKYTVKVFKKIMEQYKNSIASIYRGISYDKIDNPETKINQIMEPNKYNEVFYLFSLGIWRHTFMEFKNKWNEYISIVNDIDYRNRPSNLSEKQFDSIPGASDAVIRYLTDQNNIKKLNPVLSRARYIGVEGMTYDYNNYYNNWNHGDEGPLEYSQDKSIQTFKLIKQ